MYFKGLIDAKRIGSWFVNISIAVLLLFFASACLAKAAPAVKITYAYEAFSEIMRTGKPTGTASATALLALTNITLEHSFEYLPLARMQSQMERIDIPVCSLFSLKTKPRQSQFIFSIPMAFQSSQRLFVQHDVPEIPLHMFNEHNEIESLSELMLIYPRSKLVTSAGISHGEYLDREIAKISEQQLSIHPSFDTNAMHAKMFLWGRANFTVAFPTDIEMHQNEFSKTGFKKYELANTPPIMTSRLMCNITAESKLFIEQLNQQIRRLYSQSTFLNAHTAYLPIEDHEMVKHYISQYAVNENL
ncbi:MAG: hypothetical protein ACJA0G_001578 [Kangiellaceae bacterium]